MAKDIFGNELNPAFIIPRQVAAPQPQAMPKASGRGGTLTSLISEGGALGGGALGASIGTGILPGVGTILGGALGAGIGAFTGRVAENKVRDDRLGLGDAAQEGAISAVLGAGPIKLGKAAFGARKGSTTLAEALKIPMSSTSSAATAQSVAKTSMAGKLDEMANKALTSQYGTISKPVARAASPEKTFSNLAALGITKPTDVERISTAITGTNGLLNKAVVKSAGDSKRVDVSNLRQVLTDAIENNGVVDSKAKELTTMFDAQMKKLLGGPEGSLSSTAHPSDVLDVMKAFEKRIAQKSGKGSNYRLATDETVNQANALKLVRDELQDRLESGADVTSVLTPGLRNKLVSLHPNNEAWQKYVDNNIMKSRDLKNLRSAQAPFVNARKIIDDADLNSMTFGGRLGNNANLNLREALTNAVIGPFKDPARRAAASVLKTASNVSSGLPPKSLNQVVSPVPMGLKIGAKGQVGEGLITTLLGSQSSSGLAVPPVPSSTTSMPFSEDLTNPTTSQATTSNMQMNNNIISPQYTNSQEMSSNGQSDSASSPYDVQNIEANIQKIIEAGGKAKDVQDYLSIAAAINQLKAKSSGSGLNTTTATQVASSANATNTLSQLEGLYNTAGGGSGKVGGSIKNALSRAGLEGNTQTYNDLSASSVSQLARALNGGGQVSDADAAVVVQALPRITDSREVAARKFAALKARLEAARQNTLMYNGVSDQSAPTDLMSALGM